MLGHEGGVVSIDRNDSMESAMNKFEATNIWSIPVTDDNKYVGFVSRSNIFSKYRRALKQSVSLF